MVGLPGWRICVQPSPIEMPKSWVMRFEISPEISSSFAGGTSPVLDQATVGSDISSATHGIVGRQRSGKESRTDKTMGGRLRDGQQSQQECGRKRASKIAGHDASPLEREEH